jgi:hypothetical protein
MAFGLRIALALVFLAGWTGATPCASGDEETVPVVAKLTRKLYGPSPHGSSIESVRVGIYLRRSDGSAYERTIPQSGISPDASDEAWLWLASEHKLYRIEYGVRRAVRMPPPADLLRFPYSLPSQQPVGRDGAPVEPIGRKVVSGLECEGFRRLPEGNEGETLYWLSPALSSLPLLSRSPEGDRHQVVIRMEDVEVGKEPDPRFFEIPAGFEVVE